MLSFNLFDISDIIMLHFSVQRRIDSTRQICKVATGESTLGKSVYFCQLWTLNYKLADDKCYIDKSLILISNDSVFLSICNCTLMLGGINLEESGWCFQVHYNLIRLNPFQFCYQCPIFGFPSFFCVRLQLYSAIACISVSSWTSRREFKIVSFV